MNGGGPGGFMPPRHGIAEKNKEPKPKSLREVPTFVKRTVRSFFKRLFYILSLVWETSPFIFVSMVAVSVISGILPVLGTYVTAEIINVLAGDRAEESVLILLFVFQFVYVFFNRLTGDVNRTVSSLAGEKVTNHIRRKIMRKAKEIDIACFDRPDFFEELENANREAGMRPVQILTATLNIISTTVSIVTFSVTLFSVNAWVPVLAAVFSLPSALVSFIYRKKTVGYMRLRSKARRQMNYFSSVTVDKDAVKEIRILGLGNDFEKRYDEVFKDYFSGLRKIIVSEGVWNTVFGFLRIGVTCFIYFFIAKLVLQDNIQVGDYSFYTGALSSVSAGVTSFISGTSTVFEGTLFIDNLISFLGQEKTVRPLSGNGIIPQRGIGHKIEFKHVYFKYSGSDRYVLEDLNLVFETGTTCALVGLNGAGKTTVIRLMTRLYDPTMGQVLLDGTDIREYNVEELYKLYGTVFQDFGRYAVTVKENIAFGDINKEIDIEEIKKASKESNADTFIETMPKGYDTPLMKFFEEDGWELSTGQWQKIAVARAFYGNNDILILDEPTASLDAIAEQEIFREFDTLRKNKTTLFISHRLSGAVDADKIYVLKGGKITESGTHGELMAQKGDYAEMFLAQAEKYREEQKNIKKNG